MRTRKPAYYILSLVTAVACESVHRVGLPDAGRPSSEVAGVDAGPVATWLDHLNDLSMDVTHPLYSYHFVDAPPDGARYYFAIFSRAETKACAHFSGGGMIGGTGGDFWLLEAELGGGVAGNYAVAFPNYIDDGSLAATVRLSHVAEHALVESYRAVGGQITVESAPSLADAKTGKQLAGRIEVDFEKDPVRVVNCQGGASVGGGNTESTCTCAKTDATSFSCRVLPDGFQSSCCHAQGAPTMHVSSPFVAEHCTGMCTVLAGLPSYCNALM